MGSVQLHNYTYKFSWYLLLLSQLSAVIHAFLLTNPQLFRFAVNSQEPYMLVRG